MFQNFRLSMAWLHTWFGLVLGYVLMAVFFFGALSVFDREIDRWAIPESRFEPQPMPSFDKVLRPIFESMQPKAEDVAEASQRLGVTMPAHFDIPSYWSAYTTHRDPVLGMFAGYEVPDAKNPEELVWSDRTIDPRTGASLPDDQLKIGSRFFYPLHYSLNFSWMSLGYWIVGFASLIMLVALVSGVVMHRKIFREMFTFRPKKSTQRSALDLHNLTGVVALPFHFFFAFTGLVIFAGIYFPVAHTQMKALHDQHEMLEAKETGLPNERAGVAEPLGSVDAMVAEAQRRWAEKGMAGDVGLLVARHIGDANGFISIYRAGTDRVALTGEGIHFKASTGEVMREDPPETVVHEVGEFLSGLHLQHFRHWLLRWFYVIGGLAGCVCIATGFIFFVEKRKRQYMKDGNQTGRVVDALAVTTVTGMLLATLGILIANRLLPATLPEGWPGRANLEQYCFWGTWVLAMAHAFLRSAPVLKGHLNPAWREQCLALAVLAPVTVLLNWLTTGDHLGKTLGEGYWPVAGLDLSLLVAGIVALIAARHLARKESKTALSNSDLDNIEVQHG